MVHITLLNDKTPNELQVLTYLKKRMHLSVEHKNKYSSLAKGHTGEMELYNVLKRNLHSHYEILTDVILKHNDSEFQIDILLIGKDTIYLLEVKNYEGNFIIENDSWYVASSQTEIRNPLHQLKRMEILLKNTLQQTEFHFSLLSHVIFVNPEFYLYQAPLDLPLVFSTQIQEFIKTLQSLSPQHQARQNDVIKFLESRRLTRSTYEKLPTYTYKQLRKGIVCCECSAFLSAVTNRRLICKRCNTLEGIETAIKRNVIEFITLFPEIKVTTNKIYDWCMVIQSKKSIRRVLKKHLTPVGIGRQTYYVARK